MVQKVAVIVKGNPKYLNDPSVKLLAVSFYKKVQSILESKGYSVTFDDGEPMTLPSTKANVWVGHSRGIDRLRFAPKYIKTIALTTNESSGILKDLTVEERDRIGLDPAHYRLSNSDIAKLNELK